MEVTLRSHLTEFVDHELTRTRRGADGEARPRPHTVSTF